MIRRDSSHAPLSTSAKVSLKALRFPPPLCSPTSLPQAPTSGEAGGICNGQNLTSTRMMTIAQTTEEFPQGPKTSTTRRIQPEASAASSFPGAALRPEDISDPEPHSTILRPLPLRCLYHSKVLTISRSSPLRDPLHSEDFNSEPDAPTTDRP